MKFCFKCGASLSGGEKFCPRCGQKLPVTTAAPQEQAPAEQEPRPAPPVNAADTAHAEKARRYRKCSRHGIIFTDLDILSDMFNVKKDALAKLLDQYADMMATSDIDYRLVDVSDYRFVSKAAGKKGKKAEIHAESPWWDYQHILYDILCYEKENGLPESNYLFIIGGHEVVPVPVINHYLDDERLHFKDIETDVLYGYPDRKSVV